MPGVLRRQPFTGKDMTQMSAAGSALYFDAMAIWIRQPPDGAFDFLVERGPAAAGVELRIRNVEWRLALSADVRALDEEIVVFAGKWALSPLVHDDVRLFWGELVQPSHDLTLHTADSPEG